MEPPLDIADQRVTVLVTGGCGFLGSHVVNAFVSTEKYRVVVLSRNPTVNCNPKAEYTACDATDFVDLASAIERIEPNIIVHTITPGPFAPENRHRRDLSTTSKLIDIATNFISIRAFVYSGSIEAIANASGARQQPLQESEAILHSNKTAPSAYARTKSCSAEIVLRGNGDALRTAVLHLPGMYGPHDREIALGLWNMAKTSMTKIQLGNNEVVHDWLYVKNAAHAHLLVAEALLNSPDVQEGVGGEAFFITDGVPMKFWDFARTFWTKAGIKHCNDPKNAVIIPWWCVLVLAAFSEAMYLVFTLGQKSAPLTRLHVHYMKEGAWFDISKARGRLGYAPLVQTEEGIRNTVSWFQENAIAAQQKRR